LYLLMWAEYRRRLLSTTSHGLETHATKDASISQHQHPACAAFARETLVESALIGFIGAGDQDLEPLARRWARGGFGGRWRWFYVEGHLLL
jgi:hypothetical protein